MIYILAGPKGKYETSTGKPVDSDSESAPEDDPAEEHGAMFLLM